MAHTAASRHLAEALKPQVMSASDLAKKVGVTPQAVSKWVTGKAQPSAEVMAKIEDLCGVSMREWAESDPGEESVPDSGHGTSEPPKGQQGAA